MDTLRIDQSSLDIFSGSAQTTGGQVRVREKKCYLLEFKWDSTGQWRLKDNQADILLNTREGPQKIERLPASQASRIVGSWIYPNGSYNEQTKQLRAITTAWADRVRSGYIRKSDDWYYYHSTVKIRYNIPSLQPPCPSHNAIQLSRLPFSHLSRTQDFQETSKET